MKVITWSRFMIRFVIVTLFCHKWKLYSVDFRYSQHILEIDSLLFLLMIGMEFNLLDYVANRNFSNAIAEKHIELETITIYLWL